MNIPPTPMPYNKRARRSLFKRPIVLLVLMIALAAGAWWAMGGSRSTAPKGPPPVAIRTATVTEKSVPLVIQAVGSVVAYESVAVRARLDSQVVAVHFHDGEEVKKGDLLFELDAKALRAQAEQLRANIARDRAQLDNARRQYQRAQTLADKGFATKANRDDARAALDVASASVGAGAAALENLEVQLGYTRITAPISGRTGTINVTLGNTVKANDAQPLVTINQIKPIRVQAALPQQAFDAVRGAMQAGAVTVTAMKQEAADAEAMLAEGTLEYLDNAVDAATGTFVTRTGFANEGERLWPGMFVTLRLTLGQDARALTIPEVAVQRGQNGDYVYAIAQGKAQRRDIKIARLQDGMAVIASGLAADDVVAVDGLLSLKDGASVTVQGDAVPTP